MREGLQRIARLCAFCSGLGWAVLMPGAARAQAALARWEEAARAHAWAVQGAQQEVAIAQYRRDTVEAQGGGRLSTGLSLAATREPVTDDLVRDYRRAGALVGIRWPLLGGREQNERALASAEGDVNSAKLKLDQAQAEAVLQVRLAYVDAVRSAEQIAIGQRFMALEPDAGRMLRGRARDGLLLEADRQAFESAFGTVRRDLVREQVAHQDALMRLRTWTGEDAIALNPPEPPRWDGNACLRDARVDGARAGIAMELATAQLQAARQQADRQRWTGVDAGVSLTQSIARDLGSLSGHSTAIALDVSVPLQWQRMRASAQAEASARVRRAEIDYEAARQADLNAARQARDEWQVRLADREAYEQRLAAAVEAVRVAALRAQRLDGDVLEKRLQARYALYGAAMEASQSLQRLEAALAKAMSLWPACEGQGVRPVSIAMLDEIDRLWANDTASAQGAPALHWSWFAWKAGPWLASPEAMMARLPTGTDGVMLSLDGDQLRAAATRAGHQALAALLDTARRRGLRIALLLGEPRWALSGGEEDVSRLVRPLASFAFDGLMLDLERSQLAGRVSKRAWREGVVRVARALSSAVPWRLGLITHDRDLHSGRFIGDLARAGIRTLIPMIYVTQAETAGKRLQAVREAVNKASARIDDVRWAISIEPDLPATESWHGEHRSSLLDTLQTNVQWAVADRLAAPAIAVQSFEAFEALPP